MKLVRSKTAFKSIQIGLCIFQIHPFEFEFEFVFKLPKVMGYLEIVEGILSLDCFT